MKVECIYKANYMWCEVGEVLEVAIECEGDNRHPERYGVKLKNVIGFYPKKYFKIVSE